MPIRLLNPDVGHQGVCHSALSKRGRTPLAGVKRNSRAVMPLSRPTLQTVVDLARLLFSRNREPTSRQLDLLRRALGERVGEVGAGHVRSWYGGPCRVEAVCSQSRGSWWEWVALSIFSCFVLRACVCVCVRGARHSFVWCWEHDGILCRLYWSCPRC